MEHIYGRNVIREMFPYSRTREPISLIESLKRKRTGTMPGIIMEYKRSSPSGFENRSYPSVEEYFRKKISPTTAALSILTEPDYFRGSYRDIVAMQGIGYPILDKDFISTEPMLDSAYNAGADAVLLIMDFLPASDIRKLTELALRREMEVLIEFHDLRYMDMLQPMDHVVYGYNRRNLRTLRMEPQESYVLRHVRQTGDRIILESGIDSEYLKANDVSSYFGLLIGSSILSDDVLP